MFLFPGCTAKVVRIITPPDTGVPPRRVSTRVNLPRNQGMVPTTTGNASRRPVGERWFYDPVIEDKGSSSEAITRSILVSASGSHDDGILGSTCKDSNLKAGACQSPENLSHLTSFFNPYCASPTGEDLTRSSASGENPLDEKSDDPFPPPLTRRQTRQMIKRFQAESRRRRRQFKADLQRDWDSQVAPTFDQENDNPDAATLIDEEVAYHDFMAIRLDRFDEDIEHKREGFLDDLFHATLPNDLMPHGRSHKSGAGTTARVYFGQPDDLMMERTEELWAGLRRVYFGEVEDPTDSSDGQPKPRTR